MNRITALAGLALILTTTVSAEARDRWRYRDFNPWHDRNVIWLEDDEDEVVYYEDEDEDVEVRPRNRLKQRAWRDSEDDDIWWLEDGARRKLDARPKKPNIVPAKPVKKSFAKPAEPKKAKQVVVKKTAKPVAKAAVADPVITASIAKPAVLEKPKAKPVAQKALTPKPISAKAGDGKSIGCTAGAAVIVGYGFADVKPKACTGNAYAYTAIRAGKNYEIKLTAASGEITDVKKLN